MRPSLMCVIYLGMLLYLPFLNLMDGKRLNIGVFKYIMTFVPYQTAAIQLGFYLYTLSTDEIAKEENSRMLRLLKSIGMSPLDMSIEYGICWFGPECLMILVSILYNCAVKMIITSEETEQQETEKAKEKARKEKLKHVQTSAFVGKCITIILLFLSAVWRHSLFGVFYFLVFLFFMSVWALDKNLNHMLSKVLFFCMPIAMVHTIGIYLFQIELIQYHLTDKLLQFR
nr:unnamed protein product [Callosobruchus chinensis]